MCCAGCGLKHTVTTNLAEQPNIALCGGCVCVCVSGWVVCGGGVEIRISLNACQMMADNAINGADESWTLRSARFNNQ
jgi:hypothetical protein